VNASTSDSVWLRRRYARDRAPVSDIAAEAGVDVSNVHRALRRHGIPLRGPAGRRQWGGVLTRPFLEKRLGASTPIRSIAEEVGCQPVDVRRWMQRHGLADVDLTASEARQLRRWYEGERLSITEIARRLQVSKQTARARLVAAEVTLRSPGRPKD
jgi:hypothetical protein